MAPRSTLCARLLTAGAAAALATTIGLGSSPAAAAPPSDPGPAQPAPVASHGGAGLSPSAIDAKLSPRLAKQHGRVAVFVQLAGQGAADAQAAAKANGKSRSAQVHAAKAARAATTTNATQVITQARRADSSARSMWHVANAVPGVAITADRAALRSIAARSDVVKITPLVPKHPVNSNASELTRVVDTWQDTGTLGAHVTVGIIDTGIDYTHADFGGPGTTAAWDTAHEDNANANWRDTLTDLAAAKVVGGYDFVGDDYDAAPTNTDGSPNPNYQPVPHPDADPIDCYGHGSHVGGILAGYGENADGSTFTGDYSTLTGADLASMTIDPGMAPAADIYSLKVFGCTGSTNEVIPALDWALDPNGDGDFSDHLDIVNMSLGADYATVDDPENAVVDDLARHGVLSVVAMGNAGDLTDVGGSPGNAVRSLAVASTVDSFQQLDGLRVDTPADVAGVVAGQMSVAYDWPNNGPTGEPVTGDVVALSSANADGCDPLSDADAALVAGKVAWLEWDSNDSTRRCGSAGRSTNVKAAGAIGAVFTGDVNPFTAGITGDADIPVFQLTKSATEQLRPALQAGTLSVTFDGALALSAQTDDPSINDLVSSFSSRGTHGSLGVVKPDLAAPGDSILSVAVGQGTGAVSESGTSMATPHAAGIAALVTATHPDWTVEQVKAAMMNTADHDVWTEPGQTGLAYGPARVGAGRVDALAAVRTDLIAYDLDQRGGVSASFGVVAAPISRHRVTKVRTIRVENHGRHAARLSLNYDPAVRQPGVSYSVSPSSLWVRGHGSAKVRVVMTVRPGALRNTIDPTMAPTQIGVPRQFVADASGRLEIAQYHGPTLRVPVYGAAKPVSRTQARDAHRWRGGSAIALRGSGVDQGTGATAYRSLVSVLDLGATSGQLPSCGDDVTQDCTLNQTAVAGDLKYVGTGATKATNAETGKLSYTDGWLYFGIATYGDWATIGNSTIPYVDFDTTGDGVADYEVYVQNYPSTDVLMAILVDLSTGAVVDLQPVNFNFGDVNTNVFDTNVLLIPVWPRAIGVTDATDSFPITYTVGTYSNYAVNSNGDIDDVGPVTVDAVDPAIQVGSPLYLDRGHTSIRYRLSDGERGASPADADRATGRGKGHHHRPPWWGHDRGTRALLLHLHGASGHRAEVVTLRG